MRQDKHLKALASPLPAKQARSQRTRDALVAAGWQLLATDPWEQITVNRIAQAAGVSVGSFYTRFKDRDAYFESLSADWIRARRRFLEDFLREMDPKADYLAQIILETYRTTMQNGNFWRAALMRGASNPGFWLAFRDTGLMVTAEALRLRQTHLGRRLRADEAQHIRFAFQMANGLINNSLVNRPGPILPGTPEFETELVRGLKAVAGV